MALAVLNQNIDFVCSSCICFCSQTCADAGSVCCEDAWRHAGGTYSFMAVSQTVDVYLDRKSDASCLCVCVCERERERDPKCVLKMPRNE